MELYKKIVGELSDGGDCNQFRAALDLGGSESDDTNAYKNKEITVQKDAGADEDMNQAYTCIKVILETDDFLGTLGQGQPDLVPLVPETDSSGARKQIDTIEVSWYTEADAGGKTVVRSPAGASASLRPLHQTEAAWNGSTTATAPSLMRFQLIQVDSTFSLSDFDGGNSAQTDRGTVLLYPYVGDLAISPYYVGNSAVYRAVDAPVFANCENSFNKQYACTAKLKLPYTKQGNTLPAGLFAKLTAYYHSQTGYKVVMKDAAGNIIKFDSVQPLVDATGRANDMYRRVESRIQLSGDAVLPEYSVDMNSKGDASGKFCKELTVTDQAADTSNGSCDK
jgi:hypothetical protein